MDLARQLFVAFLTVSPVTAIACGEPRDAEVKQLIEACQDSCTIYIEECRDVIPGAGDGCVQACEDDIPTLERDCIDQHLAFELCFAAHATADCDGRTLGVSGDACYPEFDALEQCYDDERCEQLCRATGDPEAACVATCSSWGCADLVEDYTSCRLGGDDADGCSTTLMELTACAFEPGCEAWCFASDQLGCGESCIERCESRRADDCGWSAFEAMLRDCISTNMACQGGEMWPVIVTDPALGADSCEQAEYHYDEYCAG